jgi:leucyl aminopeptidase
MIQLKHSGELSLLSSIVIVSNKKTKVDKSLSEDVHSFHKKFQKGEEKFDFLKTMNGFIFFVKEDQKVEDLRVAGAKLLGYLTKEHTSLSFTGESEAILAVTEGLLLSSYQFIAYFKDAEKKKLGLTEVFLPTDISQKKIDELVSIAKAVFWARDRVNEPVSHLNASQLAQHIADLAPEAGFTVQILEKTQIESLKMGGLLAVNRGSIDPPTFTIVEYKPEKAINKKPIVLKNMR